MGVIAAITVPSLISKQKDVTNRVKLKKAMATYDKAISQMSIVSGFKTKEVFKNWAEKNNCENAVSYFKIAGNTREGCKFRTSDGIWWDVSNIDRTMISFKESDLEEEKAKNLNDWTAFILVTSFDASNETLRVDDLGYETNNDINNSKAQVEKLYNFIKNVKITSNSEITDNENNGNNGNLNDNNGDETVNDNTNTSINENIDNPTPSIEDNSKIGQDITFNLNQTCGHNPKTGESTPCTVYIKGSEKGYVDYQIDEEEGFITLNLYGVNKDTYPSWDIQGSYDILDGDLNSDVLIIHPYSNLSINFDFENE